MNPSGLFSGTLAWLRGDSRHRLLAAGLSVTAAAGVAVAVYFAAFAGGGGAPLPQPTPGPLACALAPAIDALAAAPAGGDWQKVSAPAAQSCFSLTAAAQDASGVPVDTSFVMFFAGLTPGGAADEVPKPPAAGDVAARLKVSPPVEFTVELLSEDLAILPRKDAGRSAARYRIQPAASLAEDTVYRFSMMDGAGERPLHTWAFQTRRTLRVVSTLPADQATDVPLNVGVELTLSHDNVRGVQENFHIEPAVEGRFETHKRTVVFVPAELQPQTLYTVTLGPGVSIPDTDLALAGGFTFRFETGVASRDGQTPGGPPSLQFSRRIWEAATQETPALALFQYSSTGTPDAGLITLPFGVYRFADRDAFLASLDQFTAIPAWARATRGRFAVDHAGLEQVASFDAEVRTLGQYGDRYVQFPQPLPQGYYLVETTFAEKPVQALLQVTDMASYLSVSGTRTLLWVNDVAAKAPLAGAAVTAVGGGLSATTGADGVAFFETPPDLIHLQTSPFGYTAREPVGNIIVTAADGREEVVPLGDIFNGYQSFGFREYGYPGDPSLYWRYLYTDRNLYRPADTVRFWGLVRLRENPPPAQEVVVEIGNNYYDEKGSYSPQIVASTTVTTTAMGTFIGELPFSALAPGFYQVQARIGEQIISTSYAEVRDFVKPAYKIDVLPSRNAVFAGDSVDFTIRAQFFGGSPVPNLNLNTVSNKGTGSVTTDAAGEARLTLAATASGGYGYGQFDSLRLDVTPALAEEGEISGGAWVQVFPSALTIDARGDYAGGGATVSGTVYNVDLTRVNGGAAKDFDDFRGPPAAGAQVSVSVSENGYTQTEVGETYDFIAKIVRKEYRYDSVTTLVGDFAATTDGEGRFAVSFPAARDKSYEITLRATDDSGRTGSQKTYLYTGYSYYGFGNTPTLVPAVQRQYALGDEVALTMAVGSEDLPAGGNNRYLFYLGQNGIRGYAVQDGPRYTFTFAEEHVPTVTAIGVRFTGATYQEVSFGYAARFDQSLRELTIAVTPDRERYEPGEKPVLGVTVTDRNGAPVQAEVLLSAVDEATFRVQGTDYFNDLKILDSLYTSVPSGVLHTYASHQYPFSVTQAEKGGGDGGRQDFKDVALFDRITTDGQGNGSATFKLPDNLTSWRVTAIAVTQDLQAGVSTALVPVSLPLFADVTMNTTYLTSDQPSIRLRAFGDALGAGDAVSFEVASATLFDGTLTASGTAFSATELALPALREGTHRVTVRVTAGGQEDALVREITVVPSRLLRNEARFFEATVGQSLQPEGAGQGATTVVISDQNRGRYYPVLRSLSWTYGDRVDQMLARNLAQGLLKQYFGEETDFPAEFRPLAYQTTGGGIAIFPFADADLTLSARAAAVAPEQFDRQGLPRYFLGVLDNTEETRERGAIALYGLAALGEPVLTDAQALAGESDLTVRERLYAGLAAAALGDQDTAGRIYGALLAESGERRGPALRLNVGEDRDDILEATSLGAILGAALADDYAPLLFQYTTENYTRDVLVALEQISYLAQALPRLSAGPVRFAYTLDGARKEEQLELGRSLTLLLTPQQLQALDLQALEGTIGVSTANLAPFDPASVSADPAVSVSRAYEGQSGETALLQEGQMVKVRLSYNLGEQALDGCYQLSDLLPSGLKPVTRLYQWNVPIDQSVGYPYLVDGQRVSFCVYRTDQRRTLSYYARVIATGGYTAEPVIIQSQKAPESIALTPSLPVQIQ
ncbi:MAG: alpha-2-macroglobulin family protein [Dehalococcoidia bacterium]|nr:alpha-2-macroglobulin family protein [Dehalococcoidia bacterium]